MTRQNYGYNHRNQPHVSLEGDGAVETSETHTNSFFFGKPKILLELNNINKQIIMKSQSSLLSQGYKILIVRVM
jgi:hypothetical protein